MNMKKAVYISIAFLIFVIPASGQEFPLVFTKAKYHAPDMPAVIIISGDGGWYRFEQSIADSLAALGMTTTGLDLKKYFRVKRTPESMTNDMVNIIEHQESLAGKRHILFIGYSLGAEVIPFIINRLPEDLKERIRMYVLLSPAATTDFTIHIADMIGMESRYDTFRVIDEVKKNSGIPALCIFGSEEKTNVPTLLRSTGTTIVIIPGDHHYNRDASLIVKTMKDHKAF